MFNIIPVPKSSYYRKELNQLVDSFYKETGGTFKLSDDDEKAYYFFYKNEKHGAVGGAKISFAEEPNKLSEYFNENNYEINDYWLLENVFFYIDGDAEIHENDSMFGDLCHLFYNKLYQAISDFGEQNNIDVLLTFNTQDEHENITHFADWPFLIQHLIKDSSCDQENVLGILKLEKASLQ